MLQKTITYTNFKGKPVTETFCFHLNKAEIAELELSRKGGLSDFIRQLVKSADGGAILSAFKEIITMSVGQESEDGRRFVKSQEIVDDFVQSGAYAELLMELAGNSDAASEFVKAIVPADLLDKIEDVELPEFTDEELLAMPQDQFDKIAGKNPSEMDKRHLLIAFERRNRVA